MAKTLHSRKNTIFLSMLRGLREARRLRQSDLADLVGRSQAMVSNVERGERTLDVIELWEWLEALDVDFITFLSAFDAELRQLGLTRIPAALRKRHRPSNSVTTLKRVIASIADGER
jgi:transcriptional regulator with XRE-family HTH domain